MNEEKLNHDLKNIYSSYKDLMSEKHRELVEMYLGEAGNSKHSLEEIAKLYFHGNLVATENEFKSIVWFWDF